MDLSFHWFDIDRDCVTGPGYSSIDHLAVYLVFAVYLTVIPSTEFLTQRNELHEAYRQLAGNVFADRLLELVWFARPTCYWWSAANQWGKITRSQAFISWMSTIWKVNINVIYGRYFIISSKRDLSERTAFSLEDNATPSRWGRKETTQC